MRQQPRAPLWRVSAAKAKRSHQLASYVKKPLLQIFVLQIKSQRIQTWHLSGVKARYRRDDKPENCRQKIKLRYAAQIDYATVDNSAL